MRAKCRSVSLATVNSLVAKPTTCDRCVKSGMARLRERAAARCERVCRGGAARHGGRGEGARRRLLRSLRMLFAPM